MQIIFRKEHFCKLCISRRPSLQLQGYKTHITEGETGTLKGWELWEVCTAFKWQSYDLNFLKEELVKATGFIIIEPYI